VPKPSFVVAIIGWIAEFEVLLGYGWKCVKKCLNCFQGDHHNKIGQKSGQLSSTDKE
jgi:hypothetical protein